jgi:hypothetical protein
MQVARLTFAAQCRSDRPFRISPLTIYEAKFREKLTNNFQKSFASPKWAATINGAGQEEVMPHLRRAGAEQAKNFPSPARHG